MGSGASETLHLPPEIWELYPELTYEELIELQVMLETSIKHRPAVYGEASCSSDPFSLLKAEAGALSESSYRDLDLDLDLDLAIARSLQDDLCHLSISEPLESAPGSPENTSASSSNTTGVNQAHPGADAETYEELQQLCETVGNESKGLSTREMSGLKSFMFGTEKKSKKSRLFGKKPKATENKTTECSICLVDFKNGQNITPLPCLHQYHPECIERWLTENKACPVCRFEVKTQDLLQNAQ